MNNIEDDILNIKFNHKEESFNIIAAYITNKIGCNRAIIWLFEDHLKVLGKYDKLLQHNFCVDNFNLSDIDFFQTDIASKSIISVDARFDDNIEILKEYYLEPHDIFSIMLLSHNNILISCENTAEVFEWKDEHLVFLQKVTELM